MATHDQNRPANDSQKGTDTGQHKVERTSVALKNGMGTVAVEDYDEKIHGKALEESDEQYLARVNGRFQASMPAFFAPPTTIANLQTFPATPLPTPPSPSVPQVVSTARPVVTTDDLKGQLDPESSAAKRVAVAEHFSPVAGAAAPKGAPAPAPAPAPVGQVQAPAPAPAVAEPKSAEPKK